MLYAADSVYSQFFANFRNTEAESPEAASLFLGSPRAETGTPHCPTGKEGGSLGTT